MLVHGTNSSRRIWEPILPQLAATRDVVAVDLPGHGDSPPSSFTPPGFAADLEALLDVLGLECPAVAGHSVGGWTALELAKRGRAGAVLALAPAGLWRRHSPRLTDLGLLVNWRIGRMMPGMVERSLRPRVGRRLGLASISARPADVPADVAVALARDAASAAHFREHFRSTRVLRFEGGAAIDAPVRIVWGARDRVARSRFGGELPAHAQVETWPDCGHMVMWDRREETVAAAMAL